MSHEALLEVMSRKRDKGKGKGRVCRASCISAQKIAFETSTRGRLETRTRMGAGPGTGMGRKNLLGRRKQRAQLETRTEQVRLETSTAARLVASTSCQLEPGSTRDQQDAQRKGDSGEGGVRSSQDQKSREQCGVRVMAWLGSLE